MWSDAVQIGTLVLTFGARGGGAAAILQKPTIVNTAVRLKSRSKTFDEVNLKIQAGLQH
jgi:hypothetical protein